MNLEEFAMIMIERMYALKFFIRKIVVWALHEIWEKTTQQGIFLLSVILLQKLYSSKGEGLVCCSFTSVEKGSFVIYESSDIKEILEESRTLYAFGSVCCKLFRTSIIQKNHICFRKDISKGEDITFVLSYLSCHLNSVSTLAANGNFYNSDNAVSLSHKVVP